jgi:hypothetical protein
MRFGILLDYCNKHLDVQFLSKVYLVLFLGEMILELDKESFLTPEGVHCFLHRQALCRVLVVQKGNVQDTLMAELQVVQDGMMV